MHNSLKKNSLRKHNNYTFLSVFLFIAIVSITAITISCGRPKPIKIGFVGGLTGKLSQLGIGGRNGIILAIEQANENGGINGHPLKLIVKDDKDDKKTAVKVDQELIEEGVVAIIGHMTSSMSVAALPLINKYRILMISPTTSTNKLSGKDDYFLRVMPPNIIEIKCLADYAFKDMGYKRISIVYDMSNIDYTKDYELNFRNYFESLGGKIVQVESFYSQSIRSFLELAKKMLITNPDAILIIAGDEDTAMICQELRKLEQKKIPLLSSGWAMTDNFLKIGGPTVDGVVFLNYFDRNSTNKRYLLFKESYENRFGEEPDFSAVFGYNAANVLIDALRENDDPKTLKGTILKQKVFHGIQGDFTIDRFGDAVKTPFVIVTITKNGTFFKVKSMK